MKTILILFLFILTSCSVTEQYYLDKGGTHHTISGKIKYVCKYAIWIDSIKVCGYKGNKLIGDTLTVVYVKSKYQNEFIK